MGEGSILRVIRRYRRRRCCTCRRMYALARSLSPAGSLVYSLLPCCRAHAHPHSHFPVYSPLPCCCYRCIVVAVAVVAAATAVHTLSSFSLVLARLLAPLLPLPLLLPPRVRSLALIRLRSCSFSLLFVVLPVPVKPKLALKIVFRYSHFVGVKRT